MKDILLQNIEESIKLKETFLKGSIQDIITIGNLISDSLDNYSLLGDGGKIMCCGNGGSAADAQHFAAELTGRFVKNRKPLAALALTTDMSAITAIGNDFSFDDIFSRQVEALGNSDDILIAISTSGNSNNVIKAVKAANKLDMITVGLLGNDGGILKELCDYPIVVPSQNTARIQEIHTMIYHFWSEIIDSKF